MSTHRIGRRILAATALFLAVKIAFLLIQAGNGLSADYYSEANSIRAADAYRNEGLTSHHGLPRIWYGYRFPGVGAVRDTAQFGDLLKGDNPNEWVYTHYPPGPDLTLGVLAKVFGLKRIWVLRLWPVLVGIAGIWFFVRTLARYYGVNRAAAIAALCAAVPMFTDLIHCLHFQGYAQALLLVEAALLIGLFARGGRRGLAHFLGLALVGFLQGWLSFDQCFVVAFLPLPLFLLFRAQGADLRWQTLAATVVCCGGGFTAAHGLHFAQVAAESGGIAAAIADLGHAAARRAGTTALDGYVGSLWHVIRLYPPAIQASYGYFGLIVPFMDCVLILMVGALAAGRLRIVAGPESAERGVEWRLHRGYWWPLLAAFAVSAAWVVVMPGHGREHLHFIPRHFFVLYLTATLCLVTSAVPLGSGARPDGPGTGGR